MATTPGRPRRRTRLARALGLDGNPLRRASDRAETWIRIGLLAVFLIAAPIAAPAAGGWAHHAGIIAGPVEAAPAYHLKAAAFQPPTHLAGVGQARVGWQSAAASARADAVLAVIMTLAFMALALLAAQRLIRAFLTRRRLAAWAAAWSKVGPQWSGGRT